MTGRPLSDKIARRIRAEGALTMAAYMAMALHDPDDGYYARRHPIGAAGDFITAPEISQVFGELIGLWCADLWQRAGRPDPLVLIELGPGRGTLMADLLRAAAVVPAFRAALRVHLVEASAPLRAEQRRRLGEAEAVWVERLDEVPPGPMLIVANEFFDALPVRQFVRGADGWAERLVGLGRDGRLALVESRSVGAHLLIPPPVRDAPAGAVVEISPPALALIAAIAQRLREATGALLLIDYGRSPQPAAASLRAMRAHRPADLLEAPGSADLTADVDFDSLAEIALAAGAAVYGPENQGDFLRALGAEARLARLLAGASTVAQRARLEGGVRRLIDAAGMGTLFKAMAVTSPGFPAPEGFVWREAVGKRDDHA